MRTKFTAKHPPTREDLDQLRKKCDQLGSRKKVNPVDQISLKLCYHMLDAGLELIDLMEKQGKCITCPKCGWTSYNPGDIRERYCGHCHEWHDQMKGQKTS